jgi:peptidoglycan hydrolase CwlO-like protein
MFGNEMFDHWLNQKSLEILNKVEKEKLSTEDMLILSLKAQTNHFDHMDKEFRGEFNNIQLQFRKIDERFEKIDEKFEKVEERFEKMNAKFDKMDENFDKRFDRLATIMMWQAGIMITLFSGVYFKLYS